MRLPLSDSISPLDAVPVRVRLATVNELETVAAPEPLNTTDNPLKFKAVVPANPLPAALQVTVAVLAVIVKLVAVDVVQALVEAVVHVMADEPRVNVRAVEPTEVNCPILTA